MDLRIIDFKAGRRDKAGERKAHRSRLSRALCAVTAVGMLISEHPFGNEQSGNALRGVNPIKIAVGPLDDDARKCNVTTDGLDAAARIPLSNSSIKVTSAPAPVLYVEVTVMRLSSGLCVASYEISLRRWSVEFSDLVAVWENGGVLTGSADSFGSRTNQAVEDTTKLLIAAWLKANP